MTDNITDEKKKIITAGVFETSQSSVSFDDFLHSMDELAELASACCMQPAGSVIQQLDHRSNPTYMGQGKLEELKLMIDELKADMVIFNDTLTPIQIRNLQNLLKVPVMDRTALILEIFKLRARSRESRLQVELARLSYLKPRLIGMWETQNRQGGASGSMSSKGEGETQLELDRRTIDHRIAEMRRELKEVERERDTQRRRRKRSELPLVALVGYTNAGKSTIMNAFVRKYASSQKTVFEADMLFATLDTTIRKMCPGENKDFLMSDTVGFIQQLPTGLIEAFKSTLEEILEADLILLVADCSDPHYREHIATSEKTIAELGGGHIPIAVVYNKADLTDPPRAYPCEGIKIRDAEGKLSESVYISARDEISIEYLKDMISRIIYKKPERVVALIPYTRGDMVSYLQTHARVISAEYGPEGTKITADVSTADRDRLIKEGFYVKD